MFDLPQEEPGIGLEGPDRVGFEVPVPRLGGPFPVLLHPVARTQPQEQVGPVRIQGHGLFHALGGLVDVAQFQETLGGLVAGTRLVKLPLRLQNIAEQVPGDKEAAMVGHDPAIDLAGLADGDEVTEVTQ